MARPKSPQPRQFPVPLEQVRDGPARGGASDRLQRPQRLLEAAASDRMRRHTPVGLGLDSAAVRARMVDKLRAGGIADERVLAAFLRVPRHLFVDSALANQAYEDTSLPIGFGQTISKPSVVAQMLQALLHERPAERPLGHVLEVGTGCGYQAALLSQLALRVVSIERVGELARKARDNLGAAGLPDVEVLHGDGRMGAPERGRFDAIVSAAGGVDLPDAWLMQLAVGGRLVAPGNELRPGVQELVVVDRHSHGSTRRVVGDVYFVPLKSGAA